MDRVGLNVVVVVVVAVLRGRRRRRASQRRNVVDPVLDLALVIQGTSPRRVAEVDGVEVEGELA